LLHLRPISSSYRRRRSSGTTPRRRAFGAVVAGMIRSTYLRSRTVPAGGDRCFFDITNLSVRITDQCFWLSSLFLSSGNSTAIPVRGRSTWHGTEFCLFITSKTVSACRIFRLDAFPDGTCVCNSAILIGRQPDLSSVWLWLGKEIKPPHFRFPCPLSSRSTRRAIPG
jgi:hypothetical protein